MTKRADLFNPGMYVSIPLTIMCRDDITPAAKLIWIMMAYHLGLNNSASWPSEALLAKETGLNRVTASRAGASLESLGLVVVHRRKGGVNHYEIRQPEAVSDLPQNVAGTNLPQNVARPVANCSRSAQNLPHFVTRSTEEKKHTERSTEVLPPSGGGALLPNAPAAPKRKATPPGPSADIRQVLHTFTTFWTAKYTSRYPVQPKDFAIAKTVWAAVEGDWALVRQAFRKYLADDDKFFEGHPLGKLPGQLPKYLAAAPKAEEIDWSKGF